MEITKKKKDILKMLANGKRPKDIAKDLNLAVGTINAHIRELKLILSAGTPTELITKSIKEGIINV